MQISPVRHPYFALFAVVLTFFVLELSFRWLDSPKLFREVSSGSGLFELNPAFGKSLQLGKDFIKSPAFKAQKDRSKFRIFIIGEPHPSKPFNPNSHFAHMLNGFLQQSFPDKEMEIIPISFSSASSFIQLKICSEILKYEPDLVILLPGRDEFTGAHSIAGNIIHRNISDFSILPHSKIYQKVTCLFDKKYISELNPKLLKQSVSFFENNLEKAVLSLRKKNIQVAIVNNSANLADYIPESRFCSSDSTWLKTVYENGKKAYESYNYDLAHECFSNVIEKEKTHAGSLYYLGKIAQTDRNYALAKQYFLKAQKFDLSKARPGEVLNRSIFRIAIVLDCKLIDLNACFVNNSEGGIPGKNLFSGLHPNLLGNFLLAGECFKVVKETIDEENSSQPSALALSEFDFLFNRKMAEKTNCDSIYPETGKTDSFTQKIMKSFSEREITWEESMNRLYNYYISRKDYQNAFTVIRNLALENPYNTEINNRASETAAILGDSQQVVHYAKKVYSQKPNEKLAERIFIHYLKLDKPENALTYILKSEKSQKSNNLILSSTLKIIQLKKLLVKNPCYEIKREIAQEYETMGNIEIANLYYQK